MKNTLFSLLVFCGSALAHPGHGAPTIHVHLADIALLAAAAIFLLGIALGVKELLARK